MMKTIIVILALIAALGVLIVCVSLKKESTTRVGFEDEEHCAYYELKMAAMEEVLGKSHELVGHAVIPFDVGGAVDMYYFPNGIEGTGLATLELINPDGSGPVENSIGTYELVTFTRLPFSDESDCDFSKIERRMCSIFTTLGSYSKDACLEPRETAEIPSGEGEPNKCLIFDDIHQVTNSLKSVIRDMDCFLSLRFFRKKCIMQWKMEGKSCWIY